MSINRVHYVTENETQSKNVRSDLKSLTVQEINDVLNESRSEMINVCMNLTSDFNKSSVVRTSNAFLGKEVIMVGKKKFDRRGTVGSHHYENIFHSEDIFEVIKNLHERGYKVYAVDNVPEFNPKVIYDVELPVKTAFVYGEEQLGLSHEVMSLCDEVVFIPMTGSVRSLNVSNAAAIMMSEYVRQHRG